MWTIYYTEILIFMLIFVGIYFLCLFQAKEKKQRNQMLFALIIIYTISAVGLGINGYGLKYHDIRSANSKHTVKKNYLRIFGC